MTISKLSRAFQKPDVVTGPFLEVSKRLKDGDKISLKKEESKDKKEEKK
jgi:hypothetical protein